MHPRDSAHPMARINYAIRAGSFAYSFLVLAIYGAERGFGAFFWIALALQFLVYPHLAYLYARHAADSGRAERINLHVDAALLGAWVGVLHFPLWIAYAALFSAVALRTFRSSVERWEWAGSSKPSPQCRWCFKPEQPAPMLKRWMKSSILSRPQATKAWLNTVS